MRTNTGSIRQRGENSWELRIYLGVDPMTRKERWATKTVTGSRRYATSQLFEFREVASRGRIREGTIAQLFEQWFVVASPAWSPSTYRETQSLVKHHLIPLLGDIPVSRLTTTQIDAFYGFLLDEGGRDGRPLSTGTVKRVHVVLHRALTQAVMWDWIWTNPAAQATPPRAQPAEIRPPTPAELTRLFDHVAKVDPLFHLFLRLAATTGARRGELLALRWWDIDLDGRVMMIRRSLHDGPNGPVLASTKTRRSNRIALDAETIELLRMELEICARSITGKDSARYVFSPDNEGERPWFPNWVTKRFLRHRKAAGLPHFRLHDLRHFMATQMLDAGVPIAVVSQRLGHARASTTLNVYAHVVSGADDDAAEVLGGRLRQAGLLGTSTT